MAGVLCSRARLVTYLPGLHVLVHRISGARALSAVGTAGSPLSHTATAPSDVGLWAVLPDESFGSCGPQGQEFQPSSNVGFDNHLERLSAPVCTDRHDFIQAEFIKDYFKDELASFQKVTRADQIFHNSQVECVIQSCPEPLRKEAPSSGMMVVTVTQKTQNDMTSWSAEVEQEREQMLDKFIAGAKEICCTLQKDGFWADFIDPSSGLAFFGPYTNNTMFETDDRYHHLGFQIEDLGCCRAIQHSLWGTHVFVGSIFTNAPPNCLIMNKLQGS